MAAFKEYGLDKIADVDMSLFALCCMLNEDYLRNNPTYYQIYLDYLQQPNLIKKISARNALTHLRRENIYYLDLAKLFLESDPEIASVLAGKHLECLINKIYYEHQSKGKRYLPQRTEEKIEELAKKKVFTA